MTDKIKCPKCDALIPLTKTLQNQLKVSIRKEYEAKLEEQKLSLSKQEKNLNQRQKKLDNKEKNIKEEIQKSLKTKLEHLEKNLSKKAKKEAQEKYSLEIKNLDDDLRATKTELNKAKKKELEILNQKRKLEEKEQDIELEVARKIDIEKKQIEDNLEKKLSGDYKMKIAEKDKQINDLKKLSDDLKRRAEQGSQQTQGEAQELELQKDLSHFFPTDNIQQVPKGVRGADVIQEVLNRNGKICGTIIWESKRTKNWNDKWIPKLKNDQQRFKADVAVIVTQALPQNIKNFGFEKGILVTNYASLISLALLLRKQVIEITHTKAIAINKDEKMNILFHYFTGQEFRQRVERIIEVFLEMKKDLDKEKNSYERLLAKRGKQLQLMIGNMAGMYGDVQGMIGSSMQTIPALEVAINSKAVGIYENIQMTDSSTKTTDLTELKTHIPTNKEDTRKENIKKNKKEMKTEDKGDKDD